MYVGLMMFVYKQPLELELSSFEVETAIEKLIRYKSPGTDKTLTELVQTSCFVF
jgi:hypothetical protein